MPKKSKKKRGAGGSGASYARNPSDGAGSSALDLDAIGQGFDDLSLGPEDEVVEVVYVEPSLKRVEWVPFGAPISRDWLRRCVQDAHGAWRDHLPSGVEPAHLTGRLIPEAAQSFADVAVGEGVVVVELKEGHVDKGLVGQLAMASASRLTMEERLAEMERRFEEMERRFDTELAREREAANSNVCREIEELQHRLRISEEDCLEQKQTIESVNNTIQSLSDNLHQLQTYMKKGLRLTNNVKKRVALTLARTAVETAVGRTKSDSDTWLAFICDFSAADWSAVGVTKKLVKDLLADGAYEFNDLIHNMPAEEVVGSIAGMQHGSYRSAWEEIFYIAFKKRVSDEVFVEEVDFAAHQQQMLGES